MTEKLPRLVEMKHDRWMYHKLEDLFDRYRTPNNLFSRNYKMIGLGDMVLVMDVVVEEPLGGNYPSTMPTTCIYTICTCIGELGYIELTLPANEVNRPIDALGTRIEV